MTVIMCKTMKRPLTTIKLKIGREEISVEIYDVFHQPHKSASNRCVD